MSVTPLVFHIRVRSEIIVRAGILRPRLNEMLVTKELRVRGEKDVEAFNNVAIVDRDVEDGTPDLDVLFETHIKIDVWQRDLVLGQGVLEF